jgi:hypothetical protein
MEDDTKYMDIKEFQDMGLLVTVNVNFFHPLGLALAINIDDDGVVTLKGLIDSRDDPEGFIYRKLNKEKLAKANEFIAKQHERRLKELGFIIQTENYDK